jgi:hypothetical protein
MRQFNGSGILSPTGCRFSQGSESSDFLSTKSRGVKSKVTLYGLNGMSRATDGLLEKDRFERIKNACIAQEN